MKAIQVKNTNEGPVLIPAELSKPEPAAGDVLVQVHAAAVTPTELLWYPTAHTKSGAPRAGAVPGHEFSGVVAAIGQDVRDFRVGDEVYGMNDWFAEGATAEFCIARPHSMALKPATLTHAAAASVPISALTAWQGLIDRAKLGPGERVLIHGGAGAVGIYAVQMARLLGARVITTVSARDIDFVTQLGADEVIDYRASRFEKGLKDVDVVFDAIGGETLERSWGVLKPGGRMITIATESEGATDQRVKDAFFIVEPNQKQLVEIGKHLEAGRLRAFVKTTVALNEAPAAYNGRLTSQNGHGKVVIAVSS